MNTLATLRLQLAGVKGELRRAKESLCYIEAQIALCVTGKNAEERKSNLLLECQGSPEHVHYRDQVEDLTCDCERLEAEIENERDQRREREWSIRERLVLALERNGLASDSQDGEFDAVGDEAIARPNLHYATYVSQYPVADNGDIDPPF